MRAFNVRMCFSCSILGLLASGFNNQICLGVIGVLLFTYGTIELCELFDRLTGRKVL